MRLCSFLVAIAAMPATAQDLTLVTWGGAYAAAQEAALVTPFEAETGLDVAVVQYDGTAAALSDRATSDGWDVVDMLADQARLACRDGTLRMLDPRALIGAEAIGDFSPRKPDACAIPQNVYARVMAYDDRAFPGLKPTRIGDFFDTETFPGTRAVQKGPDGILEWALLAEGVPPEQIYALLSTDRGLRLALRKLETIRNDIVWWTDPATPARMLAEGEAAMAAGFNGRFFDIAQGDGAPVTIVWDGRIIGVEVFAIAAATDAPDLAERFLAFASRPAAMAHLAERIPYGPARASAFDRIGLNPQTGLRMNVHLPNATSHGQRALVRDAAWYANTERLRQRRFQAWLDGAE